jgi:hypothetical protein
MRRSHLHHCGAVALGLTQLINKLPEPDPRNASVPRIVLVIISECEKYRGGSNIEESFVIWRIVMIERLR